MLPSQTSIHATQQHYARMHSLPVNFPSLRDTDVATPESFSGTKVVIRARRCRLEIHTINSLVSLRALDVDIHTSFGTSPAARVVYSNYPLLVCVPPRLYPISRSRHMREQLKHGTQPNAEDMRLGMNQMWWGVTRCQTYVQTDIGSCCVFWIPTR